MWNFCTRVSYEYTPPPAPRSAVPQRLTGQIRVVTRDYQGVYVRDSGHGASKSQGHSGKARRGAAAHLSHP
eukprot:13303-Eustigmatos_ZCMA.PRE.1